MRGVAGGESGRAEHDRGDPAPDRVQCDGGAEPVVPAGLGVNIHFTKGREQDLDLIATGGFTQQAAAWAKGKPIRLYDGPAFVHLLKSTQAPRGDHPA